jgi:hypothetical protein
MKQPAGSTAFRGAVLALVNSEDLMYQELTG